MMPANISHPLYGIPMDRPINDAMHSTTAVAFSTVCLFGIVLEPLFKAFEF